MSDLEAYPCDIDDSGVCNAAEILAEVDVLNGLLDLPSYRCDIDASGAFHASDVLAVVDLLGGVGTFPPYDNLTHGVPCPSAR